MRKKALYFERWSHNKLSSRALCADKQQILRNKRDQSIFTLARTCNRAETMKKKSADSIAAVNSPPRIEMRGYFRRILGRKKKCKREGKCKTCAVVCRRGAFVFAVRSFVCPSVRESNATLDASLARVDSNALERG